MSLLAWHTLVFLIPIAVGSLLAIGAVLGLAGGEPGAGEGDGHADGNGDAEGAVGGIPLLLRLMLSCLTFGGIGLATWYLLAGGLSDPSTRAILAIVVAALGAWLVGGWLGRALARHAPLLETETVARRELVGSVGRAVLSVGPEGGLAQVHDQRGNLHQVGCHTLPGEPSLPPGRDLVLVDYDEGTGRYAATGY
jgi:hypothetical protein